MLIVKTNGKMGRVMLLFLFLWIETNEGQKELCEDCIIEKKYAGKNKCLRLVC